MQIEIIAALLDKEDLPGTPAELAVLCTRIEELMRMNGKQWVIDHRQKLIREWEFIVQRAVIRHD